MISGNKSPKTIGPPCDAGGGSAADKLDKPQNRTFIPEIQLIGYNSNKGLGDPAAQDWEISDVSPTGPDLSIAGDMTDFSAWSFNRGTGVDETAPAGGRVGLRRGGSTRFMEAINSPDNSTPTFSGVVAGESYQLTVDAETGAYDDSGEKVYIWLAISNERFGENIFQTRIGALLPNSSDTFTANFTINEQFADGNVFASWIALIPVAVPVNGPERFWATRFEARLLAESSIVFVDDDAIIPDDDKRSLFFDNFSPTEPAFMTQEFGAAKAARLYLHGTTISRFFRMPDSSPDGVRMRFEIAISNANAVAAGYTPTNNLRLWAEFYWSASDNAFVVEPNGDPARRIVVGDGYGRITIAIGGNGALSGGFIVNKPDGTQAPASTITLDDTTYSDSLDAIYVGSDVTPTADNANMWMRGLTYVDNFTEAVIDVTEQMILESWNIGTPVGLRAWTINYPAVDVPTGAFNKFVFKHNGGTTLQGQPGDTGFSIQNPITQGIASSISFDNGGASTVEVFQVENDGDGYVPGRQYLSQLNESVSNALTQGVDITQLVTINPLTGKFESAERGALAGGSQVVTQDSQVQQYEANTASGSFTQIVDLKSQNFYVKADDGETLTLDCGDPTLLPADDRKALTFLVDPENGSIVFEIGAGVWFDKGSNSVTVTEKSLVQVWSANGVGGFGGVLAVTPMNVSSGLGYTLATWGANLQNPGRHPAINGLASTPEVSSLGVSASAPVPAAGTIDTLTYYSSTGDNTTVFQLIKNGVAAYTFACVGPYGVETGIGVPVDVLDNVAIRYDAGTAPGSGIIAAYIN